MSDAVATARAALPAVNTRPPPSRLWFRKVPRKTTEHELVCFEDRGSVLDAPRDVLWEFMTTRNEFHSKAHRSGLRKFRWKLLNEITGEGTCEVVRGGKWTRMRFRMTSIRPFVRIVEEFGSHEQKMVFVYTPKGERTAVDVFVQTRKDHADETRRTLAQAHEEDVPALREFMRARGPTRRPADRAAPQG